MKPSRLLVVLLICLPSCGGGTSDSVILDASQSVEPDPVAMALENPIEEAIEFGSITLNAVDWIRAPRTEDPLVVGNTNDAYARIHYLIPAPDAARRLFVVEERGIVYLVDGAGATLSTYLDLREQDVGFYPDQFPNEAGLLGLAFHPDFDQSGTPGYGKFYTAFIAHPDAGIADFAESADSIQESVIFEWSAEDPASNRFAGEAREIIRVGEFDTNHNIGTIAFNPTADKGSTDYGLLYAGFGDGGSRDDPQENGQDPQTPLGAILRIDPLSPEGDKGYGIPADNPFVGDDSVIDEIWAYGLRHPQHFSWDAEGRMFINDIGQDQIEEINLGAAGANYGWRLREGMFATAFGVETDDQPGSVYALPSAADNFIYPVAQYDHDEGKAIGGGFSYQGTAIAELEGQYIFADIVLGRLFVMDTQALVSGEPAALTEIALLLNGQETPIEEVAGIINTYLNTPRRVDMRLGIDHEHELYLLTKGDGWIRKLEAWPQGDAN